MVKNFKKAFLLVLAFMLVVQSLAINIFAETNVNVTKENNDSNIQTVSNSVYSAVYDTAITLQAYNLDRLEESYTISPRIKIENKGTKAINLKDVKIRYYYMYDEETPQNFFCDYSNFGNQNVIGKFVKMEYPQTDADSYCEISFKDAAGNLEPGKIAEINIRILKSDWSNYNQKDDYSFNKDAANYIENNKITVNVGDNLVWGYIPAGKPYIKQLFQAVKLQMYSGSTSNPSNTLFPRFKLINTGNAPINLSDVKIRYYYTVDGDKDQRFFCDYSNIGQDKITGKFVKLTDTVKDNADCYFEMGFVEKAGILYPGKSAEVHIRIAKTDWSSYIQNNDYSFSNIQNNYVDWKMATVHINGKLLWGESSILEDLGLIPDVPALSVEETVYGAILNWNEVKNADSYIVMKKIDDGEYINIAENVNGLQFFDPESVGESVYCYKVAAVNEFGISKPSNEVQIELKDDDNDLLPNALELKYGTDPNDPDSDGDGILDGIEEKILKSNPLSIDTDNDGLIDSYEYQFVLSNYLSDDSNSDGILDTYEDFDNDGINNINEYIICALSAWLNIFGQGGF